MANGMRAWQGGGDAFRPSPPDGASAARAIAALHDPDPVRHAAISAALAAAGFAVRSLPPPVGGLRRWLDPGFDVLLLNPFLGWEDPASLLALARAIAGTRPVLVLTRHDDLGERLLALGHGADDAMFAGGATAELVVRAAALVRRHRLSTGRIDLADLSIDLIDRRVARAGRAIRLPLREYDLLTSLARTPDRVVPRATLLRAVWQIDFDPGTNRLDVHMSRLRARIDRGFAWPMLHTVKGVGYTLRSIRA